MVLMLSIRHGNALSLALLEAVHTGRRMLCDPGSNSTLTLYHACEFFFMLSSFRRIQRARNLRPSLARLNLSVERQRVWNDRSAC